MSALWLIYLGMVLATAGVGLLVMFVDGVIELAQRRKDDER